MASTSSPRIAAARAALRVRGGAARSHRPLRRAAIVSGKAAEQRRKIAELMAVLSRTTR